MMSTPALSALLHAHVHAAVHGGAGHVRVIRQTVNLVFDLHRELARRREYEHARFPGRSKRELFGVPLIQ